MVAGPPGRRKKSEPRENSKKADGQNDEARVLQGVQAELEAFGRGIAGGQETCGEWAASGIALPKPQETPEHRHTPLYTREGIAVAREGGPETNDGADDGPGKRQTTQTTGRRSANDADDGQGEAANDADGRAKAANDADDGQGCGNDADDGQGEAANDDDGQGEATSWTLSSARV